jgi:hypothetical protein
MNCDELVVLIPDIIEGTLPEELRLEAETALQACAECQRQLQAARNIHHLLIAFQAEYATIQIPAGFETRLLARIRQQNGGLEIMHLSARTLGLWLRELMELLSELSLVSSQHLPAGLEARMLNRIRQLEWLDLSARNLGFWLRDLMELVVGIGSMGRTTSQP